MKKYLNHFLFFTLLVCVSHCIPPPEENDIALKIWLADSPIDATNIESVNIALYSMEKKEGNTWKPFRSFSESRLVAVSEMTRGKYAILSDDVVIKGEDSVRLMLNMADRQSSFMVNPQSNIKFSDGSTARIYWHDDTTPQLKTKINTNDPERRSMVIVIDLDLRKSITLNGEGEYIFKPTMRVARLSDTGTIQLIVGSNSGFDENRIVIYVYKEGTFSDSELTPSDEGITFSQAVASGTTKDNKLILPFLGPGSYEIIATLHSETGDTETVFPERASVQVTKGETAIIRLSLK